MVDRVSLVESFVGTDDVIHAFEGIKGEKHFILRGVLVWLWILIGWLQKWIFVFLILQFGIDMFLFVLLENLLEVRKVDFSWNVNENFTVVDGLLLNQGNYLHWRCHRVVIIITAQHVSIIVEWNFFIVVILESQLLSALLLTFRLMAWLLQLVKKLLGMGSDLGARSGGDNFLYLFPIFAILHQT